MTYKVDGLCVPVEFLVLGPIENNVYIIGGEEAGGLVVVDPSCEADRILEALDGRVPDAIIITHCHWDHVGAAAELRAATGAPVIASAVDAPVIAGETVLVGHRALVPCPVDRVVQHGDVVKTGSLEWQVIATPGHTPGGICLFLDAAGTCNPTGLSVLVSGDTLFQGTIGRTDFAEGNMDDMRASLRLLAQLADETAVLPGHNGLTTIAAERAQAFARFL